MPVLWQVELVFCILYAPAKPVYPRWMQEKRISFVCSVDLGPAFALNRASASDTIPESKS